MTTDYKATTLLEFNGCIDKIRKDWATKKGGEPQLWFRGHRKSSWPLVPKLYRPHEPIKALLEYEDEIREEFVRRAPSLTSYRPANAWEWYFLMQHYGAPTRLLDWTEDPSIGLLFALIDSDGLHDAAIWVLEPWRVNGAVLGKEEVLPPGSDGLSPADIRRYKPWLPDRFDAQHRVQKKLPVAIFPNQFDRRISAQKSCFTLHGIKTKSLDRLFAQAKRLLARIVIPAYATDDMRSELGDYGIDEVTIYPDLEGLGKCVARWLPVEEPAPHSEVRTRLQPSPIHGVGVFAIKRIKKGAAIFPGDSDEMCWVGVAELPKNSSLRKLYDDFAVLTNDTNGKRYGCPVNFNRLTVSWYLNDPKPGEKPNVRCNENFEFYALRDIERGEELTVDSTTYSDHAKSGVRKRAIPYRKRKRK